MVPCVGPVIDERRQRIWGILRRNISEKACDSGIARHTLLASHIEDEDAGLPPPAPLRTAQDRATDAAALPTTRAGILPKLGHGFAQLGAIYIMAMEFEVRFDVVQ
jgi:hypothetical protein